MFKWWVNIYATLGTKSKTRFVFSNFFRWPALFTFCKKYTGTIFLDDHRFGITPRHKSTPLKKLTWRNMRKEDQAFSSSSANIIDFGRHQNATELYARRQHKENVANKTGHLFRSTYRKLDIISKDLKSRNDL